MKVNTDIAVRRPRAEHLEPALGIAQARPRISWHVLAPATWQEASCDIEVRRGGDVEVHGPIVRGDGVLVAWPGRPLAPREAVAVRVRVRGTDGNPSPWSDPLAVERGLSRSDWIAVPIRAVWDEDPESDRRPSLVRKIFEARADLVAARVYATAHGVFELEINGRRIGNDTLSPGWSPYGKRLRYRTYDATHAIVPGRNAIGAWLGDGWYRGRLGFRGGNRNLYGSDLSLIAQLELRYADGSREIIATDRSWRAAPSPILFSGLYDGEEFDARAVPEGWSGAGFDDGAWEAVAVGERDIETLAAPDGPPITRAMSVVPVSVERRAADRLVVDFGQNLVGRVGFAASGSRGDVVRIRHAEVLQQGEIYIRPLREARATDSYIFAGTGTERWEARFTYHGFRYAEVSGPAQVLDDIDLKAHVYHSDMRRIGWFQCSDPSLNQLHENVVWSMRGNFLDVPTDCPQRDERLGWTGDIQVFAPTANFLFDTTGLLSSWLRDLAIEQLEDGTVPWYVPVIPGREMWTPIRPGAAWGDAAVLTPWDVWMASGDKAVLKRQWDSARAWVDLLERRAGPDHIWSGDFQLGDWLDPSAPPNDPAAAMTDRDFVATAYLAWSADHLARTAGVLGKAAEAERYGGLVKEVRAAIARHYLSPEGRLERESQTGYALVIAFDLAQTPEQRATAGRRLREMVIDAGYRIATGFVGTPFISQALSSTGSLDVAYRQLLERGCPSWLYPVDQGATTVWERWDSQLEDGTVNPGQMTSFNHYAFGAVAHWMHATIAGLAAAEPGYRRIRFAPQPGGGLTWARAEHESPYGRVAIQWDLDGDVLKVRTTTPVGTSAELRLPDGSSLELTPGVAEHSARMPISERDLSALERLSRDDTGLRDVEVAA